MFAFNSSCAATAGAGGERAALPAQPRVRAQGHPLAPRAAPERLQQGRALLYSSTRPLIVSST